MLRLPEAEIIARVEGEAGTSSPDLSYMQKLFQDRATTAEGSGEAWNAECRQLKNFCFLGRKQGEDQKE